MPWVSPLSSVVTRVPASGMNFQTTVSMRAGPLRSLHGAFRAYAGLRTMVAWSFATYSLIMNGPLPTGRVWTPSPLSRTALGETRDRTPDAAAFRNGEYGVSKVTWTENSSNTLEPAYPASAARAPPALNLGSTMRSKLNLTASALNGVPSWNFTSRRSLKVTLRPSLAGVHDSASHGTSLPSGPRYTRFSVTDAMIWYVTADGEAWGS